MDTKKIDGLVAETINVMDTAQRAEPAAYLLTRINARMASQTPSQWERMGAFLGRPAFALCVVIFLVFVNLVIYGYGDSFDNTSLQGSQVAADEYSMNTSSAIFDLENIQP